MADARREDVSSAQPANLPDISELHRYPAPISIPSLLNGEAEQPQSKRQTLSKVTDSTQSTSTAEIDGHPSLAAAPTVCTNIQAEKVNKGLFLPSTCVSEHNDLTPRTLPPLPSSLPRPESLVVPQDNHQPPAVKFTIDNRVESALVEVRSLLETFQRHVQVVFRADGMPFPETVHHAGFLVGQTSPDFYKWYMAVSGIDGVSFLRFELTDVYCSSKMVSIITGGNLYDFQVLKQHIWDIFWLTSRTHGTPVKFNIIVNAAGHLSSALRTTSDQQSLRSTAAGLIAGRVNIELEKS